MSTVCRIFKLAGRRTEEESVDGATNCCCNCNQQCHRCRTDALLLGGEDNINAVLYMKFIPFESDIDEYATEKEHSVVDFMLERNLRASTMPFITLS